MEAPVLRPAAGYVRVSSNPQDKGFSPEIQHKAIEAWAIAHGFDLRMMERDVQSGSVISRGGYQRVLQAVRAGTIQAVIVYMFDRWGRDGIEWVERAQELQRADVEFHSVQEGREGEGPRILRYLRAGMAEEYSYQLAKRVRPALARSVEGGQHIGITPFGYKREYAPRENSSRRVPGLLVLTEPAASYVRELFTRYAAGGWPLRALAYWLNTDPACPPSPRGKEWTICNVQYLLRNPVYIGRIRYHHSHLGKYDTSPKDAEHVYQGRHEALIDVALFDRVQKRLDHARTHEIRSRLPRPLPIGAGVFTCSACGDPMTIARRRDETSKRAQYTCRARREGTGSCDAAGYVADVAHAGLLAQLDRLQGHPWQPDALDRILAQHTDHEERAELVRALADAQAGMERHIRRFGQWVEDPTPQELAAHRAIGRELSDRIAACEAAIAALPAATATALDLATLHAQFTRVSVGAQAGALAAAGNLTMLRELVLALVESARVTDRVPDIRSTWVRVEVTWTKNVRTLLDAGLLILAPDVDRPSYPATKKEQQALRSKRWYGKEKAKRALHDDAI